MKCIKSIKPSKNTEVGTILRVENEESELKVLTGYWEYTSKSNWKKNRTSLKIETPIIGEPVNKPKKNKK